MLQLKVKGNFTSRIKILEEQKASIEGKNDFYLILAQLLNASIQIRVQKDGKGTDGTKLSPYSDKYAEWRKSTGRETSFRDLTVTGNMFKSLSAEKYNSGARMFFNSAAEINKARGNEQRTPFFGVSDKEKKIIRSELKKLIK